MRLIARRTLTFACTVLLLFAAPFPSFSQGVPSDAHRDVMGNGWECNRGYFRVGDGCQAVTVPEHASLDVLGGHSWECNRGYVRSGNGCQAVTVPEHASLNVLGGL